MSRIRLPVWRTAVRRCGYRGFLLMLCSTYFATMYMFQSGLDSTRPRAARPDDVNVDRAALRWAHVGADAFANDPPPEDVAPAKKRIELNRVVKFDSQQEFDGIRRDQRNKDDAFGSFKRLRAAWQDDASIPPSCSPSSSRAFANPQFVVVGGDVSVYSAYWDSRPNDFDNRQNGSLIRVMAVVAGKSRPVLWCRWASPVNGDDAKETLTDIRYYELCENHNRPYGSFILHCPVPSHVTNIPCNVTLTAFDKSSVTLPIRTLRAHKESTSHNFAVCVPPLFGSFSLPRLIEFFELTILLGADRIVVYDFNIPQQVRDLLTYYSTARCRPEASNGMRPCRFDVISWPLPAPMDAGIWYHGQSIALQDCLYRNMAVSKYVLFNDVDEFIVPHDSGMFVWNDIVERLWRDHENRCALQFISAFYDPQNEASDPDSFPNQLMTMTSLQRSREFSTIRTKCLVRPLEIFEAGIHHISKPIFSNLEVHRVDQGLAYLHHYRSCVGSYGMNCQGTVEDRTTLSYQKSLNQSVMFSFQQFKSRSFTSFLDASRHLPSTFFP